MTWYASHIYAPASEALVAALSEDPLLAGGLYVVDSLPEVREEHRHTLPPGGLAVVRELCDLTPLGPDADDEDYYDHAVEWFGDDALSWSAFRALPTGAELLPAEEILEKRADEGYPDCIPPPALLERLAEFSARFECPLAYYFHFMWGGDTEIELAWLFTPGEQLSFLGTDAKLIVQTPDGAAPGVGGVLQHIAPTLGITLRSGYFAPHTRGFPWEEFRVRIR